MAYFKEQGISQSYFEWLRLPLRVREDALLKAEGEAHKRQREERGRGHR